MSDLAADVKAFADTDWICGHFQTREGRLTLGEICIRAPGHEGDHHHMFMTTFFVLGSDRLACQLSPNGIGDIFCRRFKVVEGEDCVCVRRPGHEGRHRFRPREEIQRAYMARLESVVG